MASHVDDNCLFCKIIAGKIPSFKLVETTKSYSFLDIGPLSKGHVLVIPKCALPPPLSVHFSCEPVAPIMRRRCAP